MTGKGYRPSIRQLQLEFASRLARKRMLGRARAKNPAPAKAITDNSVPWLENPDSVADFWYIACQVNKTVEKWTPPPTASSVS